MIRNLCFFFVLGSCSTMFGTTFGAGGTTCPVATFAAYQALGATGCTVNGLTYNNFTFLSGSSNGLTPTPTASQILVAPTSGSGATLDFAYPVITTNFVTFALQYDFDPVPVIADTGISLDVIGDVDVFQTLCPGGIFQNVPKGCYGRPGDASPVNLEVFNNHLGATKLTDSAPVNPPVTLGEVQLYFRLNGQPNAPAGFDHLTSKLDSVPAVPEPGTFVMLFGALVFILGGQRFLLRKETLH